MNSKFKGTGVAIVTPFKKDFSVDENALTKLVNHLIDGKVEYLVILGTTGESVTLGKEEKSQVTSCVVKATANRVPLVLGVGGNNTSEVVQQLKTIDFKGIDSILSVSPSYNKPNQEGIYQHFKAVAEASPLPVILYNVPGRTGSNMAAETTLRLAKHTSIIGIKEASGNLEQCMNIAKNKPKDFLLISGDDMLTLAIYAIGGVGVISVLANAYPSVFKKIKEFAFAENHKKAQAEQFKLLEINGSMYEEGNPVGLKYLLKLMNISNDHVRLPLVQASVLLQKKIAKISGYNLQLITHKKTS